MRCSGRRGGEGSGGGVGRRARAPQRGRRVALPAPRQPLRGRRQSQTDVRGHGTGAPAVAPSTPADVFGTLMLPTGPLAASARSPAPAVTATGGVRGTCTGRWLQLPRAGGRPLPVPRAAARFSARARQQLTPSGHMRMRAFRRRMTTMRTLGHIYIYIHTYIHNNVADRELMVTNVCDRSLYSPSHLCPV